MRLKRTLTLILGVFVLANLWPVTRTEINGHGQNAHGELITNAAGQITDTAILNGDVGRKAESASAIGTGTAIGFSAAAAAIGSGLANASINNKTSSSNKASGSAKKSSQNAKAQPYEDTPENQQRMSEGKAPIGKDGKPVELHHKGQSNNGKLEEMTRTDHRGGENFSKNHENTGQQPSQIDRSKFKQQREQYWKDKANQGDKQ